MLEKLITIDQIEVTEQCHIQIRQATKIIEDGIEISKSYHRHVLSPGDDLLNKDARVIAIANAVWTPEVIQAYQLSLQKEV